MILSLAVGAVACFSFWGGYCMDVQTFTQLISTIGFPIAACIYLAISNDKLRGIIEENTKAIAELKTLINGYLIKKGDSE